MQSSEEQVRACEEQWVAVYLATDVDGFAALLHETFVYSSERGVFHKKEYVANLAGGQIKMRSLVNKELHVIAYGDVVVSYGVASLQADFQDKDISGDDQFTRVWKNENGIWKAIALHANTLKAVA